MGDSALAHLRKNWWSVIAQIVTAIGAVGAVLWATASERTDVLNRLKGVEERLDRHEALDGHSVTTHKATMTEARLVSIEDRMERAEQGQADLSRALQKLELLSARLEAVVERLERRNVRRHRARSPSGDK